MMGMLGGVDIFFCFAFFFVREECLKKKNTEERVGVFLGREGKSFTTDGENENLWDIG